MSLPVYIIISDSEEESIFGDDETFPPMVDIHIDPASLPAPTPAATTAGTMDVDPTEESEDELPTPQSPLFGYGGAAYYSEEDPDEESEPMEEDPEEEDPEEETVPETPVHPTPTPTMMTAAAWAQYEEGLPPYSHGASTSTAAPSFPTTGEPIQPISLPDQISDLDIRIDQLEHAVESLSGPAHMDEVQQDVYTLEHRLEQLETYTHQLSSRITPPPAQDRLGMLEDRMNRIDTDVGHLLARTRALEGQIASIFRGNRRL